MTRNYQQPKTLTWVAVDVIVVQMKEQHSRGGQQDLATLLVAASDLVAQNVVVDDANADADVSAVALGQLAAVQNGRIVGF